MFQHFNIYWLIQSKEKIEFDVDVVCPHWSEYGTWHNTKFVPVCKHLILISFVTIHQYRYALMCEIKARDKINKNPSDYMRSGVRRPITQEPTTYALAPLCVSFNFIDTWLKPLESKHGWHWLAYKENIKEQLKHIPTKNPEQKPGDIKKNGNIFLPILEDNGMWEIL